MVILSSFHFTLFFIFNVKGSIHKTVKHYETLHADHLKHSIVKRGLQDSEHPYNKIKEVSFCTLGRDFRLILTPKRGILHSEFSASTVDENGNETPVPVDHENFYEGRLFGEKDSSASVHLEDGIMTAKIDVGGTSYHIEPSWRHFPDSSNRTMMIYRTSDVEMAGDPHDNTTGGRRCAYIKEGEELETDSNVTYTNSSIRIKRQAETSYEYEAKPNRTRCPLLLVADYRFFVEMGGRDTKTTINYLISLIDRVHKIYNDTVWTDKYESDGFNGMGFVIKKILVHSEPTKVRQGDSHYNMVNDKWDVRTLLEVFSKTNDNKEYCLSHLFTHQTFRSKGSSVLGLAYIASPRAYSVGGICSSEYFKNGYTLYLNSGLSSSRNHYGQRVITREADLVTAHEFGHNWGSEHDPDVAECSPGASQGGSYLMYTYSVSGYDVNNKKFSPCSLRSIRKVLQAKSGRCFSEPQESFCGNLRVEKNEECDAGLLGTEDSDACCNKYCKLRRQQSAVCSDKNSPCCQGCQFMAAGVKCRDAQYATCEQESRCTGHTAECPASPPMPDGTPCLERGECRRGKCVAYCETKGLRSCMCDVIGNACKRCCRENSNNTCAPVDPTDILPDGTPCIQGFCNKGVCEKTIQDVVERFWDIIEEININQLLLFLRDNIVGTVVLISAVIWIPASCVVNYVDKQRLRKREKRKEWSKREDLMYFPNDSQQTYPKKVIYVKVPQKRRQFMTNSASS